MLGLLRRLHCMQIQIALEAEDNEIKFQRRDKREQITEYDMADISLENIAETINNAKKEAQVAIEKLGMKSSIKVLGQPTYSKV